jgi:hypothetical protein
MQVRVLEKDVEQKEHLEVEVLKLREWKDTKTLELNDLMEQVDQASVYQIMVETLTDKNLHYTEKCSQLEAAVTDLENAIELSEELESQQTDEIKALQRELAAAEVALLQAQADTEAAAKAHTDARATIEQFRAVADRLKRENTALQANSSVQLSQLQALEQHMSNHGGVSGSSGGSSSAAVAATRAAVLQTKLLQLAATAADARAQRLQLLLLPTDDDAVLAECSQLDDELQACRVLAKATAVYDAVRDSATPLLSQAVAALTAADDSGAAAAAGDGSAVFDSDALEICVYQADAAVSIVQAVNVARQMLMQLASAEHRSNGVSASSAQLASVETLLDDVLQTISTEGYLTAGSSSDTIASLAATTAEVSATLLQPNETAAAIAVAAGCELQLSIAAVLAMAAKAVTAAHSDSADADDTTAATAASALYSLWCDLKQLHTRALTEAAASTSANDVSSSCEAILLHTQTLTDMQSSAAVAEHINELREAVRSTASTIAPGCLSDVAVLSADLVWSLVLPTATSTPAAQRAAAIKQSFAESRALQPQLQQCRAVVATLEADLVAKDKELTTVNARLQQLQELAVQSQSTQETVRQLTAQVDALTAERDTLSKENECFSEALEVLQQQTEALESEKRSGKGKGNSSSAKQPNSPTKQSQRSNSSDALAGVLGSSSTTAATIALDSSAQAAAATPAAVAHEVAVLTAALRWSRNECAHWRAAAARSSISRLQPLPAVSSSLYKQQSYDTITSKPDSDEQSSSAVAHSQAQLLQKLVQQVNTARASPKLIDLTQLHAKRQQHQHKSSSSSTKGQRSVRTARDALNAQQFELQRLLAACSAAQDAARSQTLFRTNITAVTASQRWTMSAAVNTA